LILLIAILAGVFLLTPTGSNVYRYENTEITTPTAVACNKATHTTTFEVEEQKFNLEIMMNNV
jgi:hypothetical protein